MKRILSALVLATPLALGSGLTPEAIRYTSEREFKCLVSNIYYEARGEPYLGQLAVAKVTLNRLKSENYPGTICEVVFQSKQFSWTLKTKKLIEDKASEIIAIKALSGKHELNNFNALFFHSTDVRPNWGKKVYTKIGKHIFYH